MIEIKNVSISYVKEKKIKEFKIYDHLRDRIQSYSHGMKQNTNIINVLFKTLITLIILFGISQIIKEQHIYLITILALSFIINTIINNYIGKHKNKIFEKLY